MSARPRVLVADDHRAMLDSLVRLLSRDFDVVSAVTDGVSVVDAAARHEPDLLVLDIAMPGLNGIAAAARVKASGVAHQDRVRDQSSRSRVRRRRPGARRYRLRRQGSSGRGSAAGDSHGPERPVLRLTLRRPVTTRTLSGADGLELLDLPLHRCTVCPDERSRCLR